MNMASAPQQWNRRDRNTIVGPNNEVRTKHDTRIEGQSNAQRLALEADEFGVRTHVGNKAFNSFRSNMKQRGTHKGVASHGTGRAGSDAESTKGGAMDPQVRLLISRAINSGLIDKCNGVVKQGKEAMVYHAESGANGGRFDIAVKVFKRIQEFRGRGDYVDGDPRYIGRAFRNAGKREQLEMWAEKEFRNLVRSNRALVPVPTPLHYKDNIVYMRFLGADGWPAPQLRELDLRRGSKRWDALYTQVMEAIRR
jgi:serine/threonine-protein kinase RIO1